MNTEQRLAALEREVADLRRLKERVQVVPWNSPSKLATPLIVGKGQTLYSGASTIYGIVAIGTDWTANLPTSAPGIGSSYTNGLGYAFPVANDGTISSTPVWLLNSYYRINGQATGSSIVFNLPENSLIYSTLSVNQTVDTGGTAPLYIAWRA